MRARFKKGEKKSPLLIDEIDQIKQFRLVKLCVCERKREREIFPRKKIDRKVGKRGKCGYKITVRKFVQVSQQKTQVQLNPLE